MGEPEVSGNNLNRKAASSRPATNTFSIDFNKLQITCMASNMAGGKCYWVYDNALGAFGQAAAYCGEINAFASSSFQNVYITIEERGRAVKCRLKVATSGGNKGVLSLQTADNDERQLAADVVDEDVQLLCNAKMGDCATPSEPVCAAARRVLKFVMSHIQSPDV